MDVRVLIHGIVRQTTVFIAQLATTGGVRAPLAELANQVFLDLTSELEAQGVSRKVSADMFGMALRTYQKKLQRLSESSTVSGRSLWEAVLEYLESNPVATRSDVLRRFHRDDDVLVRGILRDLVETGLVSSTGNSARAVYRVTSHEERAALMKNGEGLEEYLWLLVYRDGPLTPEQLTKASGLPLDQLSDPMNRLANEQRVRWVDDRWTAFGFSLPLGSEHGWEAAMFDHYQALVRTLCARLASLSEKATLTDRTGGSTYTVKVWPGHPMEAEATGLLRSVREQLTALRTRVNEYNRDHSGPTTRRSVLFYFGQCTTDDVLPIEGDKLS